jgi:UDP-N-acetylglucosamine 4-epimerase
VDDDIEGWLAEEERRWVVTGAAGFIGSHLVEMLLRHGQVVVGIDDFSTGHPEHLEEVRASVGGWSRFTLERGDIRDDTLLARVVKRGDIVLHHAARGSVPRSFDHPGETNDVNVVGSSRVCVACIRAGVRALVYASSSSVYGDSPVLPRVESELGAPLSPYAAGKREAEKFAVSRARTEGLPAVGLRYFNVFGPRQRADGRYPAVIPRWTSELLAGQAPTVFGGADRSRDFTPVANVVRANLLAARAASDRAGRIYNIGLGERRTLGELFALLRDRLASRGAPCGGIELVDAEARQGDPPHGWADLTLAREELGYTPVESFEAGLDRTLDAVAPPRNSA